MSVKDRRKSETGYKGDRPWLVRWHEDGRQPSRSFTRKSDADAFDQEVKRRKQTGKLDTLDADRKPLEDFGVEFFAVKQHEWAAKTYQNRKVTWNAHVHPHEIVSKPVGQIRRSTVESFKVDLLSNGAGREAAAQAIKLVRQVLDRVVDDEIVDYNPAAKVKLPTGGGINEARRVSPAAVEKIRAQLDERSAAMVSVFGYAGLRPSELRALTWGNVHEGWIRVEAACNPDGSLKILKGQTTNRSRRVPLCTALAADLDALGRGEDDAVIFPTTKGRNGRPAGCTMTETGYGNWHSKTFMQAVEDAGVNIGRAYDLRHSIGSMWLREGIDQATVAQRLGHSVDVLQRTYHGVIEDLDPDDRRTVDEQIRDARKAV